MGSDMQTAAPSGVSKLKRTSPIIEDDAKVVEEFMSKSTTQKKFQFPGDISLAKQHAKTKYFGKPSGDQCPCCEEKQK